MFLAKARIHAWHADKKRNKKGRRGEGGIKTNTETDMSNTKKSSAKNNTRATHKTQLREKEKV